jgi:hypothetical protein
MLSPFPIGLLFFSLIADIVYLWRAPGGQNVAGRAHKWPGRGNRNIAVLMMAYTKSI